MEDWKRLVAEQRERKRRKLMETARYNVTITTTTNTDNYSGVQMDINDNWVMIVAGDKCTAYPVCNVVRVVYTITK